VMNCGKDKGKKIVGLGFHWNVSDELR
jgi:hypothetical protein